MSSSSESEEKLGEAIRSWWKDQKKDWNNRVDSPSGKELTGGELWDGMPVIDSKVAAETSPIFEQHIGIPLDTSLIREGGYSGIEDLISDLVPKMMSSKKAKSTGDKH